MIKLYDLHKYFNRNRSNEIHVINGTNLTLPQTGLVVLLGPSGSGKTTLLNVLGGLDKINKGTIDFDGELLEGYNSRKWDFIRNEYIGYVFQNYNLLNDQTVYDNIALSLRMIGIVDKAEIDKRIDYILEKMGMINYRRRRAANLSGGQQQRVAIARALAKNPKVIIADEPTGNLDSKNTYDIMNILRSISKTKLVVLVTHEEEIASLYADRIIRLKDGQIVEDNVNKSIGGVDVQLDTDIYLKDLNQISSLDGNNTSYKVYSDEALDTNFDVKLIVKNKTLYIEVDSKDYNRVTLVNNGSEIKVFDEHFEGQEIEKFVETDYDLEDIIDDSVKKEKHSVISFRESIRLGFNRFRNVKFAQVLLYVLFFLNAAIVGIALSLLFNTYTTDNLDFMTESINVIEYEDNLTFDEYMAFESQSSIEYLNLLGMVQAQLELPKIYQTNGNTTQHTYYGVKAQYMDPSHLIAGRGVQAQNEVVLNEWTVKNLMRQSIFESLGISTAKDFLNLNLSYKLQNPDGSTLEVEVDIVGITDVDNAEFYAYEETLFMMKTGYGVYEAYSDQVTVSDGTVTDTYRKFIIDESYSPSSTLALNVTTFGSKDIELVSEAIFQTTNEEVPGILIPLKTQKEMLFGDMKGTLMTTVSYYTLDPETAMSLFDADNVEYPYEVYKEVYTSNKLLANIGYILFAGTFLIASALASFFVLRSSLLSRIYEVSVYRALGAPKKDLRRLFLVEALILTLLTSLWGYLLTSFLLIRLQIMTEGFFEIVKVTPLSFTAGLVIIFGVNILSGIIPVSNLLRKTPAEIISKYDF